MHVGTYPTRNFATLGPLELRPPFVVDSRWRISRRRLLGQRWADIGPYTASYDFAKSCVFKKQSLRPLFCDQPIRWTIWCSFSRSYRANLPSSFKTVLLRALVSSTYLPVSVMRYGLCFDRQFFLVKSESAPSPNYLSRLNVVDRFE